MADLIKRHEEPPFEYKATDDDLPEIFFPEWDREWNDFVELKGEPPSES